MENLKTKTVIVFDSGLFTEFAIKIAAYFGKTYYFTPWNVGGFPRKLAELPGSGIEELENIDYPFTIIDEFMKNGKKDDLICVFLDVYFSDIQVHLFNLGFKVWGSKKGEDLELNRIYAKKIFKKSNLAVNGYAVVKGIKNLREWLKTHKNKWIKIDHWRGEFETFKSIDYKLSEPILDKLEQQFGVMKWDTSFLVEDVIDSVCEIGFDTYVVDDKFPKNTIIGIEQKGCSYIGKVFEFDKLPKNIKNTMDNLKWYFKENIYRGNFSNELRVTKNKIPYLIDPCCFSANTEVLTDQGWKLFSDLNKSEKICTLNPENNNVEYHSPINYIGYEYNGDMISISNNNKDLNLLVTPNHSVWYHTENSKKLVSKRADSITGKISIPRTLNWIEERPDFIELPQNRIPYKGMVYDVEVENHIIYVRVNGRPCWSGNCRLGSPPNEVYQEMITNWGDIIWQGSQGVLVEPIYKFKFGAEAIIHSNWLTENWQTIHFPEEIKKFVKIRNFCIRKGEYHIIPQPSKTSNVGAVIGMGNTMDEAVEQVKKNAELIKGYGLEIELKSLDDAIESCKNAEKIDIKF